MELEEFKQRTSRAFYALADSDPDKILCLINNGDYEIYATEDYTARMKINSNFVAVIDIMSQDVNDSTVYDQLRIDCGRFFGGF